MVTTERVISDGELRCIQCGYQLRGLTRRDRCPECGFEVYRTLQKLRGTDPLDAARRLRWLGASFLTPLLLLTAATGCIDILAFTAVLTAALRIFLAWRLAAPSAVNGLGFPASVPHRLRIVRLTSWLESWGFILLLGGWFITFAGGEDARQSWLVFACFNWAAANAIVMWAGGAVAAALADHWEHPLARLEVRNQRLLLILAAALAVTAWLALPATLGIGARHTLFVSFGTFCSTAIIAGVFTLSAYGHLAQELINRLPAGEAAARELEPAQADSASREIAGADKL